MQPASFGSALVLTHDVDTGFGYEHIQAVCEVEQRLGLRGSWNIVPNLYKLDGAIHAYLYAGALEIGLHDWNHDGRLFSKKETFDARIGKINEVIRDWGVKGFRAGMVFHNDEWMQALECDYDSSYYDTDPYQPMGGGCGKIHPFMLGHLVELPYTMPQDHTLFVARAGLKVPREERLEIGYRKSEIVEWIRKYLRENSSGGDELPRRKQRGIRCHSVLDMESSLTRWIPAFAGMTYPPQAAGNEPEGIQQDVLAGVDIWKMKAAWLVENGGMVLMLAHPDYLCHPRLRRKVESRQYAVGSQNTKYMGWLGEDDRDIREVRERGIVEERWFGSLLEQYAAFLNWFKREFEGQYWHCLPMDLAKWYRGERVEE